MIVPLSGVIFFYFLVVGYAAGIFFLLRCFVHCGTEIVYEEFIQRRFAACEVSLTVPPS